MLFNYRGCFWARCEDLAFVGVGFFAPVFVLDQILLFSLLPGKITKDKWCLVLCKEPQ